MCDRRTQSPRRLNQPHGAVVPKERTSVCAKSRERGSKRIGGTERNMGEREREQAIHSAWDIAKAEAAPTAAGAPYTERI